MNNDKSFGSDLTTLMVILAISAPLIWDNKTQMQEELKEAYEYLKNWWK